jgi:hypothetical protein
MTSKEMTVRFKELQRSEKKGGDIYADVGKKKKGKKLSQESIYTISLSNFFLHSFELILLINHIDEEEYTDKNYGMLKRNIELNKKFKKLSALDWEHSYDINDVNFRGKFATIFLFKLIRETNKLVKKSYQNSYDSKKRFKVYNHILNKIIERSDLLVTGMLTNDFSYAEPLQAMTQMMLLTGMYDDKILERLDDAIKFLEEQCENPDVEDGIIINNILKTAFMLSTLTLKLKKTPQYIEGDYRTDDETMFKQLGQLGYAIIHSQTKGNRSFFYDVMVEAKPKILTRYDLNEFPEVAIGCQALLLLELYMDSPVITKYINKMMR